MGKNDKPVETICQTWWKLIDKVFFLKTCMPYGGVEAKKELTDKHVFRYLNTR
jgi:hypothetical protein